MAPKRELSREEVEEIRGLWGKQPAAETKKRFGIGSTRLYKIWQGKDVVPASQVANVSLAPPLLQSNKQTNAVAVADVPFVEPMARGQQANAASQLSHTGDGEGQQPNVVDFYERLGRLEARMGQATGQLAEVLALLEEAERDEDKFLDELREEVAEMLEERATHRVLQEKMETRMDLQKLWQMVETAQRWAYLSLAALFVWKVASTTWERCAPPTSSPQAANVSAPGRLQQQKTQPGNSFHMV